MRCSGRLRLTLLFTVCAIVGSVIRSYPADAVVAWHNGYCSAGERCFAWSSGQSTSSATDVSFVGGQYDDPNYPKVNLANDVTYPQYFESPYPLIWARNRYHSTTYQFLCIYQAIDYDPAWPSSSLDYFVTNWVWAPSRGVARIRSEQLVTLAQLNSNSGKCPDYDA